MKQVKLIVSTVFIFIFIATGVVFNACVKDPCENIDCKNNGVCRDGRCKCGEGFEGPFCEVKTYEKFIGTYQGKERCNGLPPEERTLVVAPGNTPNAISIYDVLAQVDVLNAMVNEDDITIPEQTINNIVYKGYGDVEGIYIRLWIEKKDNTSGVYSNCVTNATKFVQE